jgi:hypothetical protein
VTGDHRAHARGDALQQLQRSDVIRQRMRGIQIEERNQDVRQHVAGHEHAGVLDQERSVAEGMRPMLHDPHLGAGPRNPCGPGGKAGELAEQLGRDVLCVLRRQRIGHPIPPVLIRAHSPNGRRARRGAVPRHVAEVGVPEHVVPVRMRRETGHDGLAQFPEVASQIGHLVGRDAGIDQQHAVPPPHDGRIALDELALVHQHTIGHLRQHDNPLPSQRICE